MSRGERTDLGTALARMTERLDRKSGGGLTQIRVVRAWSVVAGDTVDSHTAGAHLREGELVVFVDSPAWATELSALSEQYRNALNQELGQNAVRSVRFAVSKKVIARQDAARGEREALMEKNTDEVDSIPLTDTEIAQITESVAGIKDEDLREAVLRATIADFEWKKGIAAAKRRENPRGDSTEVL